MEGFGNFWGSPWAGRRGYSQAALGEKLGVHPFRVKVLWEQAGQFSSEELRGALMDLIHLQAGVVTGRLGKRVPAVWMEWWILKWGKNRMASASKAIRLELLGGELFMDERGQAGDVPGGGIGLQDSVGLGLVQDFHGDLQL